MLISVYRYCEEVIFMEGISRQTKLTKMVRNSPTPATGYHLLLSFAFTDTFIQNANAGPAIKRFDKNIDATSGPNINLPPQKNFCENNQKSNQQACFHIYSYKALKPQKNILQLQHPKQLKQLWFFQ